MKRLSAALLLLLLLCTFPSALASVPYDTLTIGMDGELVKTQTAYEPILFMNKFGDESLKKPSDMCLASDGNLYIADTGNKRILVITKNGEFVKAIGDKKSLKTPTGVFVDKELNVYVADEGKKEVVVFDAFGTEVRSYGRPDHPTFGKNMSYIPTKVSVDSRGRLYIISKGNYNGIIHLNQDGRFLGYFGANTSKVNALTMLKEMLYSSAKFAEEMTTVVPISMENLCIDAKGMVYVVTASDDKDSIRRLNVAGRNNLTPDYTIDKPTSVALTPYNSVLVANNRGEIMELTNEGYMLFLTSAITRGDERTGLFKSLSALAVDESCCIYVLDKNLCSIQVLAPTEFADIVHQAFSLFHSGQYARSKELWQQAKRMNGLFSYASMGLGEALFREGDFGGAMAAFRHAGQKEGYSDAFWEVRADWMYANMGRCVLIAALLAASCAALRVIRKKTTLLRPLQRLWGRFKQTKLMYQLSGATYMLRNPNDACYRIKRQGQGSYLSALIVLCLFFMLYVIQKYYSGFIFKTVRDGVFEIVIDAEVVFILFGLLVTCSYLVSTIREGEARLKDLFISFAYSLTPMLVFMPASILLSNVLTQNEAFLITMLQTVAVCWTAVLMVLSMMYQNDYSFKKTVVVLIWTAFAALVVLAIFFIVLVLSKQLWDFVQSIYGEVVYRFV